MPDFYQSKNKQPVEITSLDFIKFENLNLRYE